MNGFDDEFYAVLFVVVMDHDHAWVPSVMTAKEIGDIFTQRHLGADVPDFKVYDIDAGGNMFECEIVWTGTTFTEDERDGFRDYAHHQGRIVRKDTTEFLAAISYTVDLRA